MDRFWGNEDMGTASGTSALLGYTYPAAGEYTIHVFAVQADGIGYFAGTKQVTVGDTPAAPSDLWAAAVSGQQPHADGRMASHDEARKMKNPAICGAFRGTAVGCDDPNNYLIPPRGVEPLSSG